MNASAATLAASVVCGVLAGDGARRILERGTRRQLVLGANEMLFGLCAAAGFVIGIQSGMVAH